MFNQEFIAVAPTTRKFTAHVFLLLQSNYKIKNILISG